MERTLHVDNMYMVKSFVRRLWDPVRLIAEKEVVAEIKELRWAKTVGPTGVVSEMMKVSRGFGMRWMTDMINNIVKYGYIPDE